MLRASASYPGLRLRTEGDFYMGVQPDRANYFNGALDEVSLFDRALEAIEISRIYLLGAAGKCPPTSNRAPVVLAGPDRAVASPADIVVLQGSASDDGLPAGGSLTYAWTVVSAPAGGSATLGSPSQLATTATFSSNGVYVLKLTAHDGERSASDSLEVRVGCGTPTPSGLVASWNAADYNDSLGRLPLTTTVTGLSLEPAGLAGSAFRFNGTSGGLNATADPVLDVGAGNGLTLEAWINPANATDWHPIFEWNNGSASGVHFWQQNNAGGLYANLVDTANGSHPISTATGLVVANAWQHVALTYDRSTGVARIFRNGVQVLQQTIGSFALRTSDPLHLGRRPAAPSYFFNGLLDEPAVYNRALSASELLAIYNAGALGKCLPTPGNRAPQVEAGPNLVHLHGLPAVLRGTAVDDGLPAGGTLSTTWRLLTGPAGATVAFGNANQLGSTATFSDVGIYTLELSATDGELTSTDTVTYGVRPLSGPLPPTIGGNQFPLVAAGSDQVLELGSTLSLRGSASDDGLPVPASLTTLWRLVSGPGTVTFGNTALAQTTAQFSAAGSYVLELRAFDGALTATSTLTVRVLAPGEAIPPVTPGNAAPLVNAGAPQTVASGAQVQLRGAAADDGLPNPPAQLLTSWSRLSGPAGGAVVFSDASALKPTASFSALGTYTLELSAYDGALTTRSTTTITVEAGAPLPPVVALTSPATALTTRKEARLVATASDPDGLVTNVEFFVNGRSVGIRLLPPYELNLGRLPLGTYTFTARATDDSGLQTWSAPIVTTVVPPTLIKPTVALTSPLDGAEFTDAQPVTLTATAADADGALLGVEFYYGQQNIGAVTELTLPLGPLPPGDYAFSAVAVDDDNLRTGSNVVNLRVTAAVNQPPTVSLLAPARNAAFVSGVPVTATAGVADADGGIVRVEFFLDGQSAGARTSAPWSVTLASASLAAGPHSLTAVATDNRGATATSAAVPFRVLPAATTPPTVALVSPTNGASFPAEPDVTLTATAAASGVDNAIARVVFARNGTPLGVVAQPPYTFTVPRHPGGSWTFTATATDTNGLSATSAPVAVTVAGPAAVPPFVQLETPLEASELTQPTVLSGTVRVQGLDTWTVRYRRKQVECAEWTVLATASTQRESAELAVFDPTLLPNGLYEVELAARVLGSNVEYLDRTQYRVTGGMKIGRFNVAFNDLTVPLAGLPVTVTRIYDSGDRCRGDFGFGWRLDHASVRVEATHALQSRWYSFNSNPEGNPFVPTYYELQDDGPHKVSIVFPDGKTEEFNVGLLVNGRAAFRQYFPFRTSEPVTFSFTALPGSTGQLRPLGVPAAVYLLDDFTGAEPTFVTRPDDVFAPVFTGATGWVYTALDGREFEFDAAGKLVAMRDTNNNALTFTRDGIFHSSGASVSFTRDASTGFITAITDPAGNAVRYVQDGSGDLVQFFDRANAGVVGAPATVPTARMTYRPGGQHLLEDVFDARGIRGLRNQYDAAGRLERTTDADGRTTIFQHDLGARTETVIDRNGKATTHTYDERGNVTRTINAVGDIMEYAYHVYSDGRKSDLKTRETITGLFTNDAGQLVPGSRTTLYQYEDDPTRPTTWRNDGLLRKLTDPLGNVTRFSYDERGSVLTISDPRANAANPGAPAATSTNEYYPGSTRLRRSVDALGNATEFGYDGYGNTTSETRTVTVIDQNGATSLRTLSTTYTFDPAQGHDRKGWLTSMTDAHGHSTSYTYDERGNRLTETTTRTLENGSVVTLTTEHEYDSENRLVRSWDAEHPRASNPVPTSETVYRPDGKVDSTYDALRRRTWMEYDARGMLWKTHHADGTVEESLYDNEGRREISINRTGKRTRTVYDDIGRVSATQWLGDGSGAPITLSRTRFDAAGRVWQSEDARGKTTTMVYDAGGRRTGTINAKGQRSRFGFDANGNQETFTDALGRVVTHTYDALNRKVRTVFPPAPVDLGNGNVVNTVTETVTAYDELGRRVVEYEQSPQSVPLSSRRFKRFVYDDLGRLRGVVDAAGQWTEYRYDELGNQTHQIDALQRTTRYAYDHLGRRLTRTLPLGQVESMTYNRVGNLETRTDFNGKTTTFQYDELNRLRYRIPDASFGAPTIEFTYWPSGQRKTMSDASGVTSYFYDERDRLERKETPQGILRYAWDDQGNLTGIASGASNVSSGTLGTALGYRYDDLNRLEFVDDLNTGTTSYAYDEVGNLDTVSTPNSLSHVYRYDALNRLGTLTVANLAGAIVQHTYTKAATGHRTAHGEQWSPLSSAGAPSSLNTPAYTRSIGYGYDSLWRLRRETIATSAAPALNVATGQIDYDLDAVGNRRSRSSSVPGVINQSFTYDANDRLNSDTPDNNGNTLSGTVSASGGGSPTKTLNGTFTYDDRLATAQTTVANAPANVSYVYDGDGNKVAQTINGVTIAYLVDTLNPTGYAQVLEERTNGSPTRTYVWGHALIAQVLQGNGGSLVKTFYAYDGHGNVRLLTDESGTVTDRYHYEAFGALIGSEGTTANAHLYCGERFDSTIGQYYLRARTMNPLTGRFHTVDKVPSFKYIPESLHRCAYAHASPSYHRDPSGGTPLTDLPDAATPVGWVLQFLDGNRIHREIGEHFVSMAPATRLANYYPLSRLLNDTLVGSAVDYMAFGSLAGKPDLVDLKDRQLWEIKSERNIGIGRAELMVYLEILNIIVALREVDGRLWTPGTGYTPKSPVKGFRREVNTWLMEPGLIIYSAFSAVNQAEAVTLGAVVASAALINMAQLNLNLGTAIAIRH